ncbi:uncharacterized protein LOC107764672 [Nicotiana tabacum]|uniref:Uncharacterized protein LOC107764672 n=1 Tax=Nicotiana tabacum TaxID=4097 RepID=A0AC58SQZ7_TOBAC
MAMILRLQEEKASIEMDARQYQRLIEEEMNVLTEILVRTEREKHFLEKELEVYRQMSYLGNEESTVDSGILADALRRADASSDPTEDPVLMLHQISTSFEAENRNSVEVISVDNKSYTALGGKAPIQKQNKDASSQKQVDLREHSYSSQEFQEKEMVLMVNTSDVNQKLPDHAISLGGEVLKENPDTETCERACINVSGKDKCLKYHETDGYQGLKCPWHVKEKAFSKCFCRNATKLLRGSNGSELGVPNTVPWIFHHSCSYPRKTIQLMPHIVF